MARVRDKLAVHGAEQAFARSPVLWLAIVSAAVMLVFFGWLFSLAFAG
jgi:hypothetical protein